MAAQAGHTVVFHEAVVSQDIHMVNGRPYVPLADMAKALGGFAVRTASGYQIKTKEDQAEASAGTDAGGASGGLNGRIGDTLSDGKWRFRVVDLKSLDTYTLQQDGGVDAGRLRGNAVLTDRTIDAKPDYSLVTLVCRVRNGQRQAQAFGSGYGRDTVLIDDKGTAYAPIGWDQDGGRQATKPLPPGAAADLTAIFLVPFGTDPRDAVVTLTNVSDPSPHNVHIALGPNG